MKSYEWKSLGDFEIAEDDIFGCNYDANDDTDSIQGALH